VLRKDINDCHEILKMPALCDELKASTKAVLKAKEKQLSFNMEPLPMLKNLRLLDEPTQVKGLMERVLKQGTSASLAQGIAHYVDFLADQTVGFRDVESF
jgi:hypothetical protein